MTLDVAYTEYRIGGALNSIWCNAFDWFAHFCRVSFCVRSSCDAGRRNIFSNANAKKMRNCWRTLVSRYGFFQLAVLESSVVAHTKGTINHEFVFFGVNNISGIRRVCVCVFVCCRFYLRVSHSLFSKRFASKCTHTTPTPAKSTGNCWLYSSRLQLNMWWCDGDANEINDRVTILSERVATFILILIYICRGISFHFIFFILVAS